MPDKIPVLPMRKQQEEQLPPFVNEKRLCLSVSQVTALSSNEEPIMCSETLLSGGETKQCTAPQKLESCEDKFGQCWVNCSFSWLLGPMQPVPVEQGRPSCWERMACLTHCASSPFIHTASKVNVAVASFRHYHSEEQSRPLNFAVLFPGFVFNTAFWHTRLLGY